MTTRPATGWVGWVVFAGVMLAILGAFNAIYGFIMLFNDTHLAVTEDGLLVLDYTAWGWILIIVGIVQVFAAYAVFAGQVWGRIVAVLMASVNFLLQLAYFSAHPIWSTLIMVIDMLVIYALIVHGDELADI